MAKAPRKKNLDRKKPKRHIIEVVDINPRTKESMYLAFCGESRQQLNYTFFPVIFYTKGCACKKCLKTVFRFVKAITEIEAYKKWDEHGII